MSYLAIFYKREKEKKNAEKGTVRKTFRNFFFALDHSNSKNIMLVKICKKKSFLENGFGCFLFFSDHSSHSFETAAVFFEFCNLSSFFFLLLRSSPFSSSPQATTTMKSGAKSKSSNNNANSKKSQDESNNLKVSVPSKLSKISTRIGVENTKTACKAPLNIDSIIDRLLAIGKPNTGISTSISEQDLAELLYTSRILFMEQPMFLELKPPVCLVGDVHGQFTDVIRIFGKIGFPNKTNYLFLGMFLFLIFVW